MRVDVDFDLSRLGEWSPEAVAVVEREAIARYSAAIGETDMRCLDGALAPLPFGVVPSWGTVASAFSGLLPAEYGDRVVHGEHDIRSPRPLRPGDRLATRTRLVSVAPVSSGTVVVVEAESRAQGGELLIAQTSTAFYRGVHAAEGAGPRGERPGPEPDEEWTEVSTPTDPGLPARYAEASGDRSAIHLDVDAARAAGLPGVIVHGICLLAIAGVAITAARADADAARLQRLRCRFADVAFPGDTLVTRIAADGDEPWFTMRDGERIVLGAGRAELAAA